MKEFNENQIDDFLLGNMQQDDLKDFESKLSTDKEFAQRVAERKEVIQYIDLLGDVALKKRIQNLHPKAVENLNSKKSFRLIPILKYAIAALFIAAIAYWFLYTPDRNIYDQYYQAYDLNFGNRGSTTDEIIAFGGRLYADKNYAKALEQFNALPAEAVSAKVQLAKGISYLETKQYTLAEKSFQQLIDKKDPIYEGHARWYLAMTYFKTNTPKKAKLLLQEISKADKPFNQKQAKAILELLE